MCVCIYAPASDRGLYPPHGMVIPLSHPPVGWCGVWNSIGFSFKNKCVSIPCHAMRCHFHMLRAMILFMRALQHLLFFMLSYVLSCKLFHLALIEFICIFIGFNMFHEPPRPPLWDGMGLEISLNYLVPPKQYLLPVLGSPTGCYWHKQLSQNVQNLQIPLLFLRF